MNLKHEQNKLFQLLEFTTGLVQLNFIFFITLLPVITIFPSLYALTAVTRQWSVHRDYSVFRSYIHFFKEALHYHLKFGILWTFILLFLLIDFLIIRHLETRQTLLFTGLSIVSLSFLAISVFIFPILSHYELKKKDALKLALFSSIRYGYVLLFSFLLLTTLCILAYQSPLYLLFGFSFVIFLTTKLYLHQLDRTMLKS